MALLAIFANNILPIFLIAGLGFMLARYLHADPKTLSTIVFNVLSPALIFHILVTTSLSVTEFGRMALFSACTIGGAGLIAWAGSAVLRLDRPTTIAFVIVAMFANAGNYGLPLVLFAFGDQALTRATIYFVIHVMLLYTVGIVIASSGRAGLAASVRTMLRVPHLYAIALAAVFLLTGATLPVALMRPVTLLNDAALPTMILLMGMQIANAARPERPALVGVATGLRLVVLPLLALALAGLFSLTGPDRQAAVVQAGMPAAVMVTVLSVEFQTAPAFATAVVFVSTVLSPLTLSVLILFLQR